MELSFYLWNVSKALGDGSGVTVIPSTFQIKILWVKKHIILQVRVVLKDKSMWPAAFSSEEMELAYCFSREKSWIWDVCSPGLAFSEPLTHKGNILKISSTVGKDWEFRSMGFLRITEIPKSHLLVKMWGLILRWYHSHQVNFSFRLLAG